MRTVLALMLVLGLAACATEREGGATYDALKQAQEKCAAEGGKLTLQDGGNPHWLEDYSCKGK
jgi:uncharacterized lipoprotein YmbA